MPTQRITKSRKLVSWSSTYRLLKTIYKVNTIKIKCHSLFNRVNSKTKKLIKFESRILKKKVLYYKIRVIIGMRKMSGLI